MSGAVACSVDGCSAPVSSRGWCEKHYTRWKRHGDPVFAARRWRNSTDAAPAEKKCTRCEEVKPIVAFAKDSRSGDGVRSRCKECTSAIERETRDPERDRARSKIYQSKNPEKTRERVQRWRSQNADRFAETSKIWRESRPEAMKAQALRHYEKVKNTPAFRVKSAFRSRVYSILKGKHKDNRRTFDLVGYTIDELKQHLEAKFVEGMSWDNYGRYGWHIDHIIPLSVHNYQSPDDIDFKKAWSLSNLQPLWANDNWSKHAKLAEPFQPSLALAC